MEEYFNKDQKVNENNEIEIDEIRAKKKEMNTTAKIYISKQLEIYLNFQLIYDFIEFAIRILKNVKGMSNKLTDLTEINEIKTYISNGSQFGSTLQ